MGLKVVFRVLFFSWSELPRSDFYLFGCLQYCWVFARDYLEKNLYSIIFYKYNSSGNHGSTVLSNYVGTEQV